MLKENKRIKIYMGITTIGSVVDSQAYTLREIEELYADKIELVYPDVCVRRMFHDYARNKVCEEFLASDCDVLWFLDSDITPSKFIMDLVAIYWDKWQLAGATYPVFMQAPGSEIHEIVYTAYDRNPNTGNFTPAKVPTEGQAMIDGLATGCLFIKREVLEKLEKPYFEFKFRAEDRNLIEGEDLGFCRKVADLGYKFFTDFKYACRHEKRVDLMDVNNYAIQYSNRSVLTYDTSIKETISKSLNAAYQQGFKAAMAQAKPQPTLWLPK